MVALAATGERAARRHAASAGRSSAAEIAGTAPRAPCPTAAFRRRAPVPYFARKRAAREEAARPTFPSRGAAGLRAGVTGSSSRFGLDASQRAAPDEASTDHGRANKNSI